MSNILFITSSFLPRADANGICVANVIKSLQERQHKVFCICDRDNNQAGYEVIDGIHIYRINRPMYARIINYYYQKPKNIFRKIIFSLCSFIRKFMLLFLLPIFPDVSPYRSLLVYKLFEKIHCVEPIDCVIGAFKPYEGIKVTIKVKEKYPRIVCISYYLDLLRGALPPKPMPASIYNKLCYYKELSEYRKLDKILLPIGGKLIYETADYEFAKDKITYVDFPLYVKRTHCKNSIEKIYEQNNINIIYAGTIDYSNRNPEYLLKVLGAAYLINNKIRFHLYGINNCPDIINRFEMQYPGLIYNHGQVEYAYIDKYIYCADFVVNITNKTTTNMVPSKIFQLFSSKKPIINVINNRDDITLHYFKQYPLVCYLSEYDGIYEKDIINLNVFMNERKGANVNSIAIDEVFKINTPDYTSNIIDSIIREER